MRRPTSAVFLPAILALAFSACDDDAVRPPSFPAVGAELGIPVKLHVGQVASYDGGRLKVAFNSLLEDSRCPVEYVCPLAGEVRADLGALHEGVTPVMFELGTSPPPSRVFEYAGFRIEYLNLEPYPSVTHPPQRGDYLLSIVVTAL